MRGAKPRVPLNRLVADFEAGLNTLQIATKHGMSREAVRWRLNQWKPGCVNRRFRRQQYERLVEKLSASTERMRSRIDRDRRIVDDARSGMTFNAIGRKYGLSGSFVAWLAVRRGVPKRRVCTRQRDAEWLAMHEQGLTVKEVAARVGKPWSTVREGIVRVRDGYVFREREFNR
jgi:transposase